MLERPAPRLLVALLASVLALAACASGRSAAPEATEPGARRPGPVLESVRPGRPDDRAAAARAAWLERQAAARRGQPAASPPATAAPAGPTQQGTPGKLLIFSSVTGHVPVDDVQRSTARTPEQRENERVAELERALEAEREREQRPQEAGSEAPGSAKPASGPQLSVLSAPVAPSPPELDPARLSSQTTSVPAGSWGNAADLPVVRRSLDADGNGRPEEVRYFEVETDALLRREEDRDLDGNTDAWSRYEQGALVERVLDTNADGRPDEWEYYANGRMTLRELDGDHDGNKDVSYHYRFDSLSEVRRDTDGDGAVDRVENYEHRQRVQLVEDANRDQRMDTWTTYRVVQGEEVVARIERDPQGRGKPTVFESYRAAPGKPVLEKREEDLDGDGVIDTTQEYQRDGTPAPTPVEPL
jgi:hypothetical protein